MAAVHWVTEADLPKTLGQVVVDAALAAIAKRGKFTVAVSGGSLPQQLGAGLAGFAEVLAPTWPHWHVFYADERCVALDSADSNHKLCEDALYSKDWCKIPRSQIYTYDPAAGSPEAAAAAYSKQLDAVFGTEGLGAFDLLLLGMGPDGHCCSLFPGHPLLDERTLKVAAILDSPKPPPQRITLTFPVLNAARMAVFTIAGSNKLDALKQIFAPGPVLLPASRVRPTAGELMWIVDIASMAALSATSAKPAKPAIAHADEDGGDDEDADGHK